MSFVIAIMKIPPVEQYKIAVISVNQYTLDGQFIQRFGSIVEAANSLGLYNGAHISDVCRGKRKQCKGYIWKYTTDVDEDCDENEEDE